MIKKNINSALRKPSWMKIKLPSNYANVKKIKNSIRNNRLHTVCEEASCPNIVECFNSGTATFMILGTICTRNCPFCNISHGSPYIPDSSEPERLVQTITDMDLRYVVITSVNRDDLRDGGAKHFANCISAIRANNANIRIETLVPDFRGKMEFALEIINTAPPNIFNHNIENVPRLYSKVRPGANYKGSLSLLKRFKEKNKDLPTKSGLMLGIGENNKEIIDVMHDLRSCGVTMLTLGQYLQPSSYHLPVKRYISIQEFEYLKSEAIAIGFTHVACGPFVRSSYHADLQEQGIEVK